MEDKINEIDILASLDISQENKEQETNYEEVVVYKDKNFEDIFSSCVIPPLEENINNINEVKEHDNTHYVKEVKKSSIFKKIKSLFKFTTGYISTSFVIFAVLLLFSNYSAYYNIIESYIFQ
jgi:hypothetical protein